VTRASEIARFLDAELRGDDIEVGRPASWIDPPAGSVTFARDFDPAAAARLSAQREVLVIAGKDYASSLAGPHIVADNPRLAFAKVVGRYFAPRTEQGISQHAVIHPSASIGSDVTVAPFCVVGPDVRIGDRSELRPHVVLASGTVLGHDTLIKSNTVIGEEGFGFETDDVPIRMPHLGAVRIGDHVEVGALCSIARGTLGDTTIGDHVKIDDHVFIAHNVTIGRASFVIAGAEVSGSVHIGSEVWIGPQATIRNQVSIGDGALVGMGAVVTRDVPAGMVFAGNPAKVVRERTADDR